MNCIKCGSPLTPDSKFCIKCGMPVNQAATTKSPSAMPKPGMPKPGLPRPGAPVPPTMPKPGMPRPGAPVPPTMPKPGAPTKGAFTNAVRSVANALTGGALERDIAKEKEALSQPKQESQDEIKNARNEAAESERARVRAERDARSEADRLSMELVDGIEVVSGRAIWNIQPGEIARRLKESELKQIIDLKGVIIQEGCSALIFANGQLVTTLSSGAYLFYKSLEEEQAALKKAIENAEKTMAEEERRQLAERRRRQPTFNELGIVGEIGRAARWVHRLIFGQKKNDPKFERAEINYAKIIASATQVPILAVYIVSNRQIPLIFGGKVDNESKLEFAPYSIPMGIHNVEIGVSLEVCVSDIHQLAVNYLSDHSNLTTTELYGIISPAIESILKTTLRNCTYEASGLPLDVVDRLKEEIRQAIDNRLHGIRCSAVHSITDNNADFERFRNVERQLYNTEREIDFMQRTGEFRNRMENEANAQQIQSARNAEDLRYTLQQLNKDQLLHDSELEEFVELNESQRRIRQATTAEEEQTALEALKKSRLVKEDEIAALEDALLHKSIPRQEITQIMRIQSNQKIEETSLKAEWALDDMRNDHDWELAELERRRNWGIEDEAREREWMIEQREYDRKIGRRKSEDDYDFEQMMRRRQVDREDRMEARAWQLEDEDRQFERQRINREDEDRFEGNRHQRNMDKLKAMAEMQAQIDAQKYQHDENIASIHANEHMNRDNNFANMSAEQIRAAQLSHLSDEAQVAMANSYSSEKEMETLRNASADKEAMMQQMLKMQQDNSAAQMNAMMQMAGMIKDTATGISGTFHSAQQHQIDKLEAQRAHEQSRNEHLQDTAIDNISQVSTAAASNLNAFNGGAKSAPSTLPQAQMMEFECYNCKNNIKVAVGAESCPICGAPFQWQQ